jgi:hypothetical protein
MAQGDQPMKKGAEAFLIIADSMATDPSYVHAAQRAGISNASLWRWISASVKSPKEYSFQYGDFGTMPLHQAIKLAKQIAVELVSAQLTQAALGFKRKQMFQGEQVFERDPQLVSDAQDPERWKLLYGNRPITDTYKRDENGNIVWLEVEEAPNVAAGLAILRAHNPKLWAEQKNLSVNGSVGLGVTVMGQRPIPIEASPVRAAIAHEIVQEAEAEAMIEDQSARADETEAILDDNTPEMVTAGPDDYDVPVEESTMSPLKRDLLARLKAGVKNPRPTGRVDLGVGANNTDNGRD